MCKQLFQSWDLCFCNKKDISDNKADMAWNRGILFKINEAIIKLYISCFISYSYTFNIKILSKVRYLFLQVNRYVDHLDSNWPKTGLYLEIKKNKIRPYPLLFCCYIIVTNNIESSSRFNLTRILYTWWCWWSFDTIKENFFSLN